MPDIEDGSVTAAIYRRVSTTEQATSGLGLADQLERCEAFIRAMDLAPDGRTRVFTDAGVSAKSLERPALSELLLMVERRQVGAVVVLKTESIVPTKALRSTASEVDVTPLLRSRRSIVPTKALRSTASEVDVTPLLRSRRVEGADG